MRQSIQITLDADTALFLELARKNKSPNAISDFINSLLRQEYFRQGALSASSSVGVNKNRQPGRKNTAIEQRGMLLPCLKPRSKR